MSNPTGYLRRFLNSATFRRPVTTQVAKGHESESGDPQPDAATPPHSAGPPQNSDIKYVDHVYNKATHAMEYVDTTSDLSAEAVTSRDATVASGDWRKYNFVVVREFARSWPAGDPIAVRLVIENEHLARACQQVMDVIPEFPRTSIPSEVRSYSNAFCAAG